MCFCWEMCVSKIFKHVFEIYICLEVTGNVEVFF